MRNMKMAGLFSLIAIVMIMSSPASAVLLEETYMGSISRIEQSKNIIYVSVQEVYQGDGNWLVYAKSSLKNQLVPGTVTNPSVFTDLKQGDPVEVTIMGGSGGEWITIGKIGSVGSTSKPVIACYGDPSRLISPFYKDYRVEFEAEPDCALCAGTTCTASMASVTVKKAGEVVETANMYPGSTHVFGWNSEYQYIPQITFVSGEAESSKCSSCEDGMIMAGPQAVSDFTIYISQRSTIIRSEVETLETTTVTEAATPEMTAAATEVQATVVQTAESVPATTPATPGFTVICALTAIFAALFVASRRMQ